MGSFAALAAEELEVKAGAEVVKKGATGATMFCILEGTVDCTNIGTGEVRMRDLVLRQGEYFGERALLRDQFRAADVRARTDCVLLEVDRRRVEAALGPLSALLDANLRRRVLSSVEVLGYGAVPFADNDAGLVVTLPALPSSGPPVIAVRGMRGVSEPLAELTGAEAGMVVNNCAAALLLMVTGLAGSKSTAISRGQIVEIGGGFRLPKMMEASGSKLMEIGTTNRTHLYDYEEAIENDAGLLLCLHRSNFKVEGFVTEPKAEEIMELGRKHQIPVVMDLGSGCLVDTTRYGLPAETTVQRWSSTWSTTLACCPVTWNPPRMFFMIPAVGKRLGTDTRCSALRCSWGIHPARWL